MVVEVWLWKYASENVVYGVRSLRKIWEMNLVVHYSARKTFGVSLYKDIKNWKVQSQNAILVDENQIPI